MNTKKYTVIVNTISSDTNISVGAKGLYLALQSFVQTSNKKIDKKALFRLLPDNQVVLDAAWDELLERGYLKEHICQDGKREYELLDEAEETQCIMEQNLSINDISQWEEENKSPKESAIFMIEREREDALERHKEDKELINFLFDEMENILAEVGDDIQPGRKIQITQSRIEDASMIRKRILSIAPGDILELLYYLPGGKTKNDERCKNLIRMCLYSAVTDSRVIYLKTKIKRIKKTTPDRYGNRYEFDMLSKYLK